MLSLMLVFVTVFSAVSCGGGLVTYKERGLIYKLPKDMKKGNVPEEMADFYYSNSERVEFFWYSVPRDALSYQYSQDEDCTPLEFAMSYISYTDIFVDMGEVTRTVDESGNVIQHYLVDDANEHYFYFDYITRSTDFVYHVTMACAPEDKEIYMPLFEQWVTYIKISE